MVLHEEFDRTGQRRDAKKRITQARSYPLSWVKRARECIYKLGYFVTAAGIERMLQPLTLVPTLVR
jgi:hypothetical protein